MRASMKTNLEYLRNISKDRAIARSRAFLEFCEVSRVTFMNGDARRFKEGVLKKRSGGRHKHEKKSFLRYCGKCNRVWRHRWFIVTD